MKNRKTNMITLEKCRNTIREDGLQMKTVPGYTFPDLLAAASSRYGDEICYKLFNTNTSITYNQLKEYSEAISSYLITAGIRKEDKIAIIGDSSPSWMLMYFGIVSIGAIAVPILPGFSDSDIKTILSNCEVKAIAADKKYIHKIQDMEGIPLFRLEPSSVIVQSSENSGTIITNTAVDKEEIHRRRPMETDLASIIYTSGTTGATKGVMLTHLNILRCADLATDQYVNLKSGMKALSILPLSHVYEFTLGQLVPLMMGLEITFLGKQPAPSIIMAALKEIRPHIMFSVPVLIEKVYKSAILPIINDNKTVSALIANPITRPLVYRLIGHMLKKKFGGRLIFFGIGGAPLDKETETFLHNVRFPYSIGYGLTETSPLIAGCKPEYKYQKSGFIGRIVSDDDVILLNTNEDGTGEVAVKGPNVMKGYFKRPDLDAEVFTADGYFRTGDLGYIDEKGQLAIKGRVKTMILGPGGENIYPEAIESIINNEEYVDESLVIPGNGGLVALVRLNLDKMQEKFNLPIEQMKEIATDYLQQLRKEVNSRVASFSKLTNIKEQPVPFERTPTLKIKRYLYDGSCV